MMVKNVASRTEALRVRMQSLADDEAGLLETFEISRSRQLADISELMVKDLYRFRAHVSKREDG